MKIEREAYETATAAGRESEVPLLLIGDKGVITDVMVIPCMSSADYSMTRLKYITPMGVHRYGKVITKNDKSLGPGLNLIEEDGRWKFIDMDKNEVQVEIIEGPPRKEENVEEPLP
ncbi:MAG TPA: hypothetical protein VMC84_11230 [Methanocella sp.]|uniref:hypothetical protein n=1 Tax=Methanocella sp. TaxID=2052833 RepID=UPI002C9DB4F8|nr:hypothetical protein [Methanocella sp.]HTY91738.1 hypothetical protein [Methanocella sp.]